MTVVYLLEAAAYLVAGLLAGTFVRSVIESWGGRARDRRTR